MRMIVLVPAVLVAGLAVGGGAFALHERQHRSDLVTTSERACAGRDQAVPGTPAALPLGLPMTAGGKVLQVTSQGRTVISFASLPGRRGDIVQVRDAVLADLRGAGYSVAGTDQEPGYEAEAELAGTHEGTLKVAPLCAGLLQVRYKIDG